MKPGVFNFSYAFAAIVLSCLTLLNCQGAGSAHHETNKQQLDMEPQTGQATEVATFGNGFFWCTEAVFQSLKGVIKAESGYSGVHLANPSYKQVCSGNTGHAEVLQITFDPSVISYEKLLEAFFYSHDPTTLNRQGNDVGTQYRSVVFYHSVLQRQAAKNTIEKLTKAATWSDPIVTEVTPFERFYKAEDYHQDYFSLNGHEPYCSFVIKPKVDKFKKAFAKDLK